MARKHFELTECEQTVGETVLYRIRATRDLPHHDVVKGELGGWVERRTNLRGQAWVGDDARVFGAANVAGNALVCGDAQVCDGAKVYGDATLAGDAQAVGATQILGRVCATDFARLVDVRLRGDVYVGNGPGGAVCGEAYFTLFGHARTHNGVRMKRVRAICDLPHVGVKKGDIGGWVEHVGNLVGGAWVADDARIYGSAVVSDKALVFESAEVFGSAQVGGLARVFGHARVYGKAVLGSDDEHTCVYDYAQVHGRARVEDCARIYGNAVVSGQADICAQARVFGNARVAGRARVRDRARLFGNVSVAGGMKIEGNAEVCAQVRLAGSACVFSLGYVGPFHDAVTVVCADALPGGYVIRLGLWEGTLDGFVTHVEQLPAMWVAATARRRQWVAEYNHAEKAIRALLYQRGLVSSPHG